MGVIWETSSAVVFLTLYSLVHLSSSLFASAGVAEDDLQLELSSVVSSELKLASYKFVSYSTLVMVATIATYVWHWGCSYLELSSKCNK